MLTSKERAELRGRANTLDTTLIVGKGGITEALIAEAENQLISRELVKAGQMASVGQMRLEKRQEEVSIGL